MAARVSTAAGGPAVDATVEELLAQQMQVVQQALDFNQAISQRLSRDKAGVKPLPPGVKAVAAMQRQPGGQSPRASPAPAPTITAGVGSGASSPRGTAPLPKALAALPPSPPTAVSNLSAPLLGGGTAGGVSRRASMPSKPLMHASTFSSGSRLDKRNSSADLSFEKQNSRDQQKQPAMFPSKEDMKSSLKDLLNKPQYDVEQLYKKDGCAQSIARNKNFQNATLLVIALNTVWIAIDTDYNTADVLCQAPPLFQVVDNFFCVWFVFEILSRFFSFEEKRKAFADAWFVFDAVLVALMVWETWIQVGMFLLMGQSSGGGGRSSSILRIFRIFRLTRVARMARLLRSVPELVVLVKGMFMAMRSVVATLVLLILIIYIFAVMFTQLLGRRTNAVTGDLAFPCFASVPVSMDCLLMHGVFPEAREFIGSMLDAGPIYFVLIILYLLLASCTVMNMLIGVLCEVVSVVAKVEADERNVRDLKYQVKRIVSRIHAVEDDGREGPEPSEDGLDTDMANATLTRADFLKLRGDTETLRTLKELDVDIVALMDFGDFLYRNSEELPLDSFLETVLQFRGGEQATVKDVVDMRKFMCHELDGLEERLANNQKRIQNNQLAMINEKHNASI